MVAKQDDWGENDAGWWAWVDTVAIVLPFCPEVAGMTGTQFTDFAFERLMGYRRRQIAFGEVKPYADFLRMIGMEVDL